jgi:hypothetical protein
MISFDPVGRDLLTFLKGQENTHQYRLVLSFFGCQPHGSDRIPGVFTLHQRIVGTQKFLETLVALYGSVIPPLELEQKHFMEVVHAWHTSDMDKKEFALHAKVAAWLHDLCIKDD